MLTTGVTPALHVDYKHYRIKQYHKENRALRTETTTPALASGASVNDARDLYLGKGLHNLSALRQVGFQANRRLLRVQTLSYDPRLGEAAFQAVQQPVLVGAQRAVELGLPGERLLVSASHSHSAPTARPLRQWGRWIRRTSFSSRPLFSAQSSRRAAWRSRRAWAMAWGRPRPLALTAAAGWAD